MTDSHTDFMPAESFIYALCEPDSRTIRYIGKARKNARWRFNRHLKHSPASQTYVGRWIAGLLEQGLHPRLIILSQVSAEQDCEEEKRYIWAARMLGFQLTNLTDGGDGASPGNQNKKGKKESPETREKKRQNMLGNQHLLGHQHSEETKRKIGDGVRGMARSAETRKRMSEAAKERWRRCQ